MSRTLVGSLALSQRRSSHKQSCSTLSLVSSGMGDHLQAGVITSVCNQAN